MLPVVLVRLLLRGLRNRAYLKRIGERFGLYPETPAQGFDFWIHAVSVGEVNAAGPLARALSRRYPDKRILLTTMTPTGADQARITMGERISHLYLPYDYPFAVSRFLDRNRPKLAIMIETELWPNVISICHRRGIPLAVVNLRLSQRSYQRYARVQPFARSVFRKIRAFAVQTRDDRDRVARLIGDCDVPITVTGNIKFEIALPASLREVAQVVRRDWGTERTVWIAGSTHEPEEEVILRVFAALRKNHDNLLLVLVPRHPERFDPVFRLVQKHHFKVARRSEHRGTLPADTEVFLGDTMGELPVFYGACDIAFVGGSFSETGGHNILEASALGKPVVFGPNMFNFLEVGKLAIDSKAGIQVSTESELEQTMRRMIDDANFRFSYGQNGIRLIENNQGALSRTLDVLSTFLGNGSR